MYTIAKQFSFSAAHALSHLDPPHKCRNLHGHNYVVEVRLVAEQVPEATRFVMDFGILKDVMVPILERLDHSSLNDILTYPTAEHIARYLYARILDEQPGWRDLLSSVRVYETPTAWAEYSE